MVTLLIFAVTATFLAASIIPCRRATRIDAATILRRG